MIFLIIGYLLFLATTSVFTQATKDFVTKPCANNKLRHCEQGFTQVDEARQCFCRRPLNAQESAARKSELCKSYTREYPTDGKDYSVEQPNHVLCDGIRQHCSVSTWNRL